MWEYAAATLLTLHGVAHLAGFMGTWHLGPFVSGNVASLPFGLTDSGRLARALGVLWVGGTILFGATAVGLVLDAAWWPVLLTISAWASLVLCIMWWKDARIGGVIDVAILAGSGIAWSLSLAA